MWWKKESEVSSKEYGELNKRLAKLESDIEEFDVKLLALQQSFKVYRTKIRNKLELEDTTKDINMGVLLPE